MPPRTKKKTLAQVIERHQEVTLQIAFIEAVLELCSEHFVYRDGVEPKSIVVSNDGRRVTDDMVSTVLEEIKTKNLKPLITEMNRLNKIKV